jgi:kynurenine 3-monooxygenase
MEKIAITGGGLVGSLLGVYLARRGYNIDIFERRPDMRHEKIQAGRSINLALSDRGWLGLEKAGLADAIRKIAIPMPGRMIHALDGSNSFLPYGKADQAIYSVSRGELNKTLITEAEKFDGVKFHFNQRCTASNLEQAELTFEHTKTQIQTTHSFSRVFGTDGAFSEVRHRMMFSDRFDYSQTYLPDGYKELHIAPNADGSHKLEKNALHIWPRGRFMLIALPNLDGSFTCTLFFPFEGEDSFSSLTTSAQVLAFFEKTFPDTLQLIPNLVEQFFHNPTSSLVIVRCFPWSYKDKFLLLGDAAHAIVPFYGQGMNCGFEDCRVFDELLQESDGNWESVFKKTEASRKPNSDAIAELALQNYIEMRDLVARPEFVLRKKIEARLNQLKPEKWLPLYSMVTFSHLPYKTALDEGRRQDAIMTRLMAIPNIESQWQNDTFLLEQVFGGLS